MKRSYLAIILIIVVVCGYATGSSAVTYGVQYTPHNLSTSNTSGSPFDSGATGTTETQICIFCHTPHNAQPGKTFLWNRISEPSVTFAMYTASPTLDFTPSGTLSEISKMCMSCHDGVTALNSMANPTPMNAGGDQLGDVWQEVIMGEWGPNIGEGVPGPSGGGNLTNDHPVSFEYLESEADPTIKTSSGSSINGLPLWNNGDGKYRVECVTCHDPHINYGYWSYRQGIDNFTAGDKTLAPFLRMSNEGSALCFSCHNK